MRELLERVEKMLSVICSDGDSRGDCPWCARTVAIDEGGRVENHLPDCPLAALLVDVRKELEK